VCVDDLAVAALLVGDAAALDKLEQQHHQQQAAMIAAVIERLFILPLFVLSDNRQSLRY
jgi:hypothetical protein